MVCILLMFVAGIIPYAIVCALIMYAVCWTEYKYLLFTGVIVIMFCLPPTDQSKYDTLTEEDVLELLNKHILSQAEFSALRTNAKERLVSQQMT